MSQTTLLQTTSFRTLAIFIALAATGTAVAQKSTHPDNQPLTKAVIPAPEPDTKPQAANPPVPGGPSLQETTDWINLHMPTVSADYIWVHTPDANVKKAPPADVREYKTAISNAALTNCNLSLTVVQTTTLNSLPIATTTTVYEIPLEKIDKVYIGETEKQDRKAPGYSDEYMPKVWSTIHFDAVRPDISRSETGTVANGKDTQSVSGMSQVVQIDSDDITYGRRIVHGLERAMDICHTAQKPEPF